MTPLRTMLTLMLVMVAVLLAVGAPAADQRL